MSARVFNPVNMSEMRRMLRGAGGVPESGVQSPTAVGTLRRPDGAAIARVRRTLFGPVDHEDMRRFVDQELATQQARDAERWGFDFVNERERSVGPGTKRYVWEKVMPEDKVPEPYALRGMEYLSKCAIHGEVVAATSVPATASTKQTTMTDFMKKRKRVCSAANSQALTKTAATTTTTTTTESKKARMSNS